MVTRCDNCGRRVESRRELWPLPRFHGRIPYVCGDCVERIAAGVTQARRATPDKQAA